MFIKRYTLTDAVLICAHLVPLMDQIYRLLWFTWLNSTAFLINSGVSVNLNLPRAYRKNEIYVCQKQIGKWNVESKRDSSCVSSYACLPLFTQWRGMQRILSQQTVPLLVGCNARLSSNKITIVWTFLVLKVRAFQMYPFLLEQSNRKFMQKSSCLSFDYDFGPG